jgi:hypothetical protein|tara:strand:+ start:5258 stop:5470 length:213 start_codon:yes stop_codon:yes gene_type:complete
MWIIDYWNENRNKIDALDMTLIKLGMVVFGFWLVAVIPSLMNWVSTTNHWYILAAAFIIMARSGYRYYLM